MKKRAINIRDSKGRFLKGHISPKKGKKLGYEIWNKGLKGKEFLKHYKGMKIWNKNKHIKESTRIKIINIKREFCRKYPEFIKNLSRKSAIFLKSHPNAEKNRRKKISKTIKKYIKTHPEFMKKTLQTWKKYAKTHPKENKKRIAKIKKVWKNPEYAKLIDRKVTAWWKEHPNIKEERSRELREFFISNPEEFKKKFMNGKNNPFKPHIKTKQRFKVRSNGEKEIADFLKEHKIVCSYESEMLILDGYVCVPDFHLKDYDIYIEFYGGYPGSRKKKILKNKLYSKYSVSCIFITPSELRDLNKAILGYLRREFGEGSV